LLYKGFPTDVSEMEPERVTFCMSQKGKQKAVYREFFFDKNKLSKSGARIYWECERRRDIHCEARITTTVNGQVLAAPVSAHNHDESSANSEIRMIRHAMKQAAVNRPEAAPADLVVEYAPNNPETALDMPGEMPGWSWYD
jgi:hypothetical protein